MLPTAVTASGHMSAMLSCARFQRELPVLLVRLLMLTLAGLQSQAMPVPSDAAKWPRFRDEAHRLSFAYPAELHPVTAPTEELRLGGWVSRVSFLDDEPGGARGKLPVFTVD